MRVPSAWSLPGALSTPLATVALACALPFLTAAVLRAALLARLPTDGDARARRLAPFRLACFIVGIVQIRIVWMAASRALGPTLVSQPGGALSLAFAGLAATLAFVAGGIARSRAERPSGGPPARDVAAVRARLVAWLAGPLLVAMAAAQLPLVRITRAGAVSVEPGWSLLALVATALGVAYGGLALTLATRALLRAPQPVRSLAQEAATAEGASLALVLRLPTARVPFPNAAALPWARTMIVTNRIVELLTPDELRAVLAHEAAHLTERPVVSAARIGAATLALFLLTSGVVIAFAALPGIAAPLAALGAGLVVVLGALVTVHRFARRMEERADAHAARTAGAEPLARALTKLHEDNEQPRALGGRRVHPDLHDRLRALGVDPGPRPPLPRTRRARLVAVAVAFALIAGASAVELGTALPPDEAPSVSAVAAAWRLRVDPWDADAALALGWAARRSGDLARADDLRALAERLGADRAPTLELAAEVASTRGACDEASALVEQAVAVRARSAFGADVLSRRLELGTYRLPPTFVRRCGFRSP